MADRDDDPEREPEELIEIGLRAMLSDLLSERVRCPNCEYEPEDFREFFYEFIREHGYEEWDRVDKCNKCPKCGYEFVDVS